MNHLHNKSFAPLDIQPDIQSDIQPDIQPDSCKALFRLPARKPVSVEDAAKATAIALLLTTSGIGLNAQSVIAQSVTDGGLGRNLTRDPETGQVFIDNNSFDIETGPLQNTSNTPLPSVLPTDVQQRQPVEVDRTRLAPNTVQITPDIEYIDTSLERALDRGSNNATTYMLNTDSVELTTEFDVNQRVGDHIFGEGIEAIVIDGAGNEVSRESAFVRGTRVQIGPNGETLPQSGQLNVDYGTDDTVILRVLNLRSDGADPTESGIYFTRDGEFIVEDQPNGGDLDFNDGEYLEISGGSGEAEVLEEVVTTEVVSEDTDTPLPSEFFDVEQIEEDVIQSLQEMDEVSDEVIERGEIEAPDALSPRLGHATNARAQSGERLVYSRYAAANQARAGSDGLGYTGQLAPLVNNPKAPPTLLSGNLTYNPFVGNNEAGLTATVGLTQFLSRTHRQATDEFGAAIVSPEGGNRRLLEPTGLFNNRRLLGYVPPAAPEQAYGDPVSSVNGIFNLTGDAPVVVAAPDAAQVGRGNAAYTDNVGGLLIEGTDGSLSFVPQWTANGYEQDPLSLGAGEATRLIYALVPQQPGQNLRLGQRYPVVNGVDSYQIADGGFTVISADRQPENFAQEMEEVYAVEDTLPNRTNAVTSNFNGIQGRYSSQFGGVRVPTVDVDVADEADARVGNTLFSVENVVTNPGQGAYAKTTRAAGFYLGGSLTGGLGNQENVISRTETPMTIETDELRIREVVNTIETPFALRESVQSEVTTTTTQSGTALFDINDQGQLTNARFLDGEVVEVTTSSEALGSSSEVVELEQRLFSQEILSEDIQLLDERTLVGDTVTSTRKESEANFAPVQGEITLGGVMNFGNTPWTAAANTLRAELFARDTVFGRSSSDSEVGWRAEAIFHPFGEVQREAYQYDAAGNVVPVYQTQPVLDANGQQMVEMLSSANGEAVAVPVNEFRLDENGDLIPQKVGNGFARGPGVYLRVEDAFDDGDSVLFAGGLQLSF
ncbi:MAG: hypothetical protein AAFO84_00720 [Cyanobacteria bacterium J06598_1]